jgi:hypothetical protein
MELCRILSGVEPSENHWHRFFTESESDPKFYTDLTQVLFPEKKGYYPAMDVDSIWASRLLWKGCLSS